MKSKNIVIAILALLVVGAGSFYGGMKYGQNKNSGGNFSAQALQNLSPAERQQIFQQFRSSGNLQGSRRNGIGNQNGGTFLSGEVISKDDKSVTIKLSDGGSKIVFFSATASIGKTTEGTAADLEVGKEITINGSANSDGSVTAQSIQIRPNLPPQGQNNNQQ